ncbi:MAG: hypothetical protein IV100_13235 [Myxococcales bacterium]|nr:hypothetical protein [Myxococcales bacterium]
MMMESAQSATAGTPELGPLPLLALLEELREAEFTGAVKVALPGEEVRIFVRGGTPLFCAGSAPHHSLGAFLLRSGALPAQELKATLDRAHTAQSRLEELLVLEGRFTPEKLRAAQSAMSHFTFADVAVRDDLDARPVALEAPKVIEVFTLDPIRAVVEFTARYDRAVLERPLFGHLVPGPRLEELETVFERVFGAVYGTARAALARGPVPLSHSLSPDLKRLVAALLRCDAAALLPTVDNATPPSSTRETPLGISIQGIPAGHLPTLGVPAPEVARLAELLAAEGFVATALRRSNDVGARVTTDGPTVGKRLPPRTPLPGGPTSTAPIAGASTGQSGPLPELLPLIAATPGGEHDGALHAALAQALEAAADDDDDETTIVGTLVTPSPVSSPAAPPVGTSLRGPEPSAAAVRPPAAVGGLSAATSRPVGPPTASTRPSEARTRDGIPPLSERVLELAERRRRLDSANPFDALEVAPRVTMSSLKEAYVRLRARYDESAYEDELRDEVPGVARDLKRVGAALDSAFADLTTRERRGELEAKLGGFSAFEVSNYFGADVFYRDGRRQHAAREFRPAFQSFVRAHQRWPHEPDYWAWSAQALWDSHQADGTWGDGARAGVERHAREALTAASDGDQPGFHELALVLLARLALERGQAAEARSYYEAILVKNPSHDEAKSGVRELSAYSSAPAGASGSTSRVLGGIASRLIAGFKSGDKQGERR